MNLLKAILTILKSNPEPVKESLTRKLGFEEKESLENDKEYQQWRKGCVETITKFSKPVKLPVWNKSWWAELDKDWERIKTDKKHLEAISRELQDIRPDMPLGQILESLIPTPAKADIITHDRNEFARYLDQKADRFWKSLNAAKRHEILATLQGKVLIPSKTT